MEISLSPGIVQQKQNMCISDYWLNDIGSEKSQNLPYFWNTKTHIGTSKRKGKKISIFCRFFLINYLEFFIIPKISLNPF